jgi:multiple antibiotic resistance protein
MQLDFLSAFVTLLVTVDPLGLIPVFLAVTQGADRAQRNAIAAEAGGIAFGILAGAALFGEWLLTHLGISMASFRIAGGLLLFAIAFEMTFGHRQRRKEDTETEGHAHPAAFPLAIPLLAGPGAITASVLIAGQAAGNWILLAGLLAVIAVVIAITVIVFRMAPSIGNLVGNRGQIVFSRLLGVLLAALAVQYVVDGVLTYFKP